MTLTLLFSVNRIRLKDGDRPTEGRLEVYFDREWGTVCRNRFDDKDASVACYQLGYGY